MQVTHSITNPRSGQYLTHAHSHITRTVAAMDSCFGLVMASSARHSRQAEIGRRALCSLPLTAEAGTGHPFKRHLHTTRVKGWSSSEGKNHEAGPLCLLELLVSTFNLAEFIQNAWRDSMYHLCLVLWYKTRS